MASREIMASPSAHAIKMNRLSVFPLLTLALFFTANTNAKVLTPPYFNLAQGRNITATATCGAAGPERFCPLSTGATGSEDQTTRCDYCDSGITRKDHRPEYATDGTERWWQSPPLSSGEQYNKVNLTVHLGQEFHVAYVFISMANSPRPGVWALERSTDFGLTWDAWQFFADTPSDCNRFFETTADVQLYYDDQVLCTTEFSKIVPLEGGEIVVSLVNGRPSAKNFSNADVLQEWTKATDVRLRMIRTQTLLGHLMAVNRQDPIVTQKYYYSIKDISIGGRCVCNGHANTCDRPPEVGVYKLICSCEHNTCGDQCQRCCPGYVQKRWRRARVNAPFVCEACECDLRVSTGECEEGNGRCLCRPEYAGLNCDKCNDGYYGYPDCIPCDCHIIGTEGGVCTVAVGTCLCKQNYDGHKCDMCSLSYYNFPECIPCECNPVGSVGTKCDFDSGQCECRNNYASRDCCACADGYYDYPTCEFCSCDPAGTLDGICDKTDGTCLCKQNFTGDDCARCESGFFGFPDCRACQCDLHGSLSMSCDQVNGQCNCRDNFQGLMCQKCTENFYNYPICEALRQQDENTDIGTIVGAVVCVAVVLAIIAVVVIIFLRRRKRDPKSDGLNNVMGDNGSSNTVQHSNSNIVQFA